MNPRQAELYNDTLSIIVLNINEDINKLKNIDQSKYPILVQIAIDNEIKRLENIAQYIIDERV